jgi:hypothetical protein
MEGYRRRIADQFGRHMPTLLYSSERIGCGATIELANKDICIVSVAQTGVRVRSYRETGFLMRFFGPLFGPILYEEKNVYTVAKTAMALSERFPQRPSSLNFRNPVLSAFAGAVWHCSSAAETAILLNETTAPTTSSRTDETVNSQLQQMKTSSAILVQS